MLIPSIDLMNGEAVQLIGGKALELRAGKPEPWAQKFGLCGEIAVVDLDAALGKGDNTTAIEKCLALARCRVGGGIRSVAAARQWLDRGAAKIVLGTAAEPAILKQLPRARLIAALDAVDGEVVVDGWRTKTGRSILERIIALKDFVGGFLITFVEREGRMGGTNLDLVGKLVAAASPARVTIAGGITTVEEIRILDEMGADAQVGMALYKGVLDLAEAFLAPMTVEPTKDLIPTVVCNELGMALGLAWSSRQSVQRALELRKGVYWSRERGLWVKGATSGATQNLLAMAIDCDRDCLRFIVKQSDPGFCHHGTASCWGEASALDGILKTLSERIKTPTAGSYTQRLLEDPQFLNEKIAEEAQELIAASGTEEVLQEACDIFYFVFVRLLREGLSLTDIQRVLQARHLQVTRRPGDAK